MEKLKNIFIAHWEDLMLKLPQIFEGIIVLIIFVLIAQLIKRIVGKRLESKTEDKLRARFVTRVVTAVVTLLGLTLAMKTAGYGDIAGGLLAGAGVSAFVIGFALKDIGENFLAGFLLSFSRPFRINDTIEVDGIKGKVIALNLRNTRIKTFDGKDIFIPNATLIKNPLQNYTLDGFMRHQFILGIDYVSDLAKAREVIQNVLKDTPGIATNHAASSVSFNSLGTSTYNITVQYWVDMFDSNISSNQLRTKLVEKCLVSLKAEGINLPTDILELRPLPNLKAV